MYPKMMAINKSKISDYGGSDGNKNTCSIILEKYSSENLMLEPRRARRVRTNNRGSGGLWSLPGNPLVDEIQGTPANNGACEGACEVDLLIDFGVIGDKVTPS